MLTHSSQSWEALGLGRVCDPLIEMSLQGLPRPPSLATPACLPHGPRLLTTLLSSWSAQQAGGVVRIAPWAWGTLTPHQGGG